MLKKLEKNPWNLRGSVGVFAFSELCTTTMWTPNINQYVSLSDCLTSTCRHGLQYRLEHHNTKAHKSPHLMSVPAKLGSNWTTWTDFSVPLVSYPSPTGTLKWERNTGSQNSLIAKVFNLLWSTWQVHVTMTTKYRIGDLMVRGARTL